MPPVPDAVAARPRGRRRGVHDRWLLTAAVFVLYAVYSLTRYPQFLNAGYDLGIFDQAVRAYSQFRAPTVPLKGDNFNLLGDHFHPILVVLAPLYWVWDDPRMLVLAQAALVAASVPIVWTMLARHVSGRVLRLALMTCYALSWPLQRMVDFDFHEIAFSVPLLALVADAIDRGSDRRLLWASLPLLLVREDMGMVVLMIGVVRLLQRRRFQARWWPAALLMVAGVVTFVLVTKLVLPALNPSGQFAYWSYQALGADPSSALRFMVLHPVATIHVFFTPWTKTLTLAFLLVPLLLLPLGSSLSLISLPLLAQRFFSSRENLWTTEFHYSAPIQVIFVCAAIQVLGRVAYRPRQWLACGIVGAHVLTPVVDVALVATNTVDRGLNEPFYRLLGPAWQRSAHMRDQQAIVDLVPAGTCVEADDRLAVHLTRTNRVTLPTLTRRTSDLVLLDMSQREVGYPLPSPQAILADVTARGYREVARRGDLVMLQRPGQIIATPECGPEAP